MSTLVVTVTILLLYSTSIVVTAQDDTTVVAVEPPQSCSVCRNGEPITLPDKQIQVPGFGTTTCAIAQSAAASFFQQGSDECNGIQTVGSICGCAIENSDAENACRLCGRMAVKAEMTRPTALVEGLNLPELLGDGAATALSDGPISCEILNAALLGSSSEDVTPDSDICTSVQSASQDVCGCRIPGDDNAGETNESDAASENTPDNDSSSSTSTAPDENAPTPTPTTTQPLSQCSVCAAAGGTMSRPDRSLPQEAAISLGLPASVSAAAVTCGSLDLFAVLLTAQALECTALQGLGPYCGCPISPTACSFCAGGGDDDDDDSSSSGATTTTTVPYPTKSLQSWLQSNADFLGIHWEASWSPIASELTCELADSFVSTLEPGENYYALPALGTWDNDALCLAVELRSSACGCEPSWRAVLLLWSYRVSGMLSFAGSAWILYDIFGGSRRHRHHHAQKQRVRSTSTSSTYHQLVAGLSAFDLISSFAYILVGVMFPTETGAYRATGNDTTCSLQGFMMQLGLTSVFFNAALAVYQVLLVRWGWTETQFERCRRHVLVTIVVVGVILAAAAWPYYGQQLAVCYIPPPLTEDASRVPISIFFTTPVVTTGIIMLVCSTILVVGVVVANRQKEKQQPQPQQQQPLEEDDDSDGAGGEDDETTLLRQQQQQQHPPTKVMVQSLGYLVSYGLTIPLVSIAYYIEYRSVTHFWVLVLVAVTTPAQGLLNALVYFGLGYQKKMIIMDSDDDNDDSKSQGVSSQPKNPTNEKEKQDVETICESFDA